MRTSNNADASALIAFLGYVAIRGLDAIATRGDKRGVTALNLHAIIAFECKPIERWKNVEFNDQQKADYVAGKTVKLEKVVDAQGKEATMYLKFNREAGRPYVYNNNPDTAQKVAPSNESRTQIAVNNDGKTNEATKHVKEPLKQGQTAPDDKKQQQEQKQGEQKQPKRSKGVKM